MSTDGDLAATVRVIGSHLRDLDGDQRAAVDLDTPWRLLRVEFAHARSRGDDEDAHAAIARYERRSLAAIEAARDKMRADSDKDAPATRERPGARSQGGCP